MGALQSQEKPWGGEAGERSGGAHIAAGPAGGGGGGGVEGGKYLRPSAEPDPDTRHQIQNPVEFARGKMASSAKCGYKFKRFRCRKKSNKGERSVKE